MKITQQFNALNEWVESLKTEDVLRCAEINNIKMTLMIMQSAVQEAIERLQELESDPLSCGKHQVHRDDAPDTERSI